MPPMATIRCAVTIRLRPWYADLAAALVAVAALLFASCSGVDGPPAADAGSATTASPVARQVQLDDVAAAVGLDFTYVSGRTGELYMHEIMGGGCALLDYDNDGDLDAFFTQGHPIAADYDPTSLGPAAPRDRLFRNDLNISANGTVSLVFQDVTESSGITGTGYGMGVAVGDFNNDGFNDLYVTSFGPNQLWRNNGDGTFSEATEQSGTADERWSTAASFVDLDLDGWLDLYVVDYLDYGLHNHRPCFHSSSVRDYCGPQSYGALPDRLFRNRGDGTFADVSVAAGIAGTRGPGLGVVVVDVDGDGFSDLYVANDNFENHLWHNRGDGTLVEEALLDGCAVSWSGEREASMGVDAGDFDGDGDEDLFVTHMDGETNTLYLNDGKGLFDDRSNASGLALPSRRHTAYAPAWLDVDNDGHLDLVLANGAMQLVNEWAPAGHPHPLREPNQLFYNLGGGQFVDISASVGGALLLSETSRGAATGDVDNDGDSDVLLTNCDGPVRLLLNRTATANHWLGLRLVGGDPPRDLLGTRVEVHRPKQPPLWRRARSDGSYCSANDPRILVGLGTSATVERVRVHWPDGSSEDFDDLPSDTYVTLRQGFGDPRQRERERS